jgi:hypothetical protein
MLHQQYRMDAGRVPERERMDSGLGNIIVRRKRFQGLRDYAARYTCRYKKNRQTPLTGLPHSDILFFPFRFFALHFTQRNSYIIFVSRGKAEKVTANPG